MGKVKDDLRSGCLVDTSDQDIYDKVEVKITEDHHINVLVLFKELGISAKFEIMCTPW
jgi:hypothetical protein